jgi:hypothetical protein
MKILKPLGLSINGSVIREKGLPFDVKNDIEENHIMIPENALVAGWNNGFPLTIDALVAEGSR